MERQKTTNRNARYKSFKVTLIRSREHRRDSTISGWSLWHLKDCPHLLGNTKNQNPWNTVETEQKDFTVSGRVPFYTCIDCSERIRVKLIGKSSPRTARNTDSVLTHTRTISATIP